MRRPPTRITYPRRSGRSVGDSVDHVVALRDALHVLASAVDLEEGLGGLLTDLRRASPSALGLEVLTVVAGQDVRLGRFLPGVDPDDVVTSLQVPLEHDPVGEDPATGPARVVFYAGRSGAFVDLAADLAFAENLPAGRLELDGQRPVSTVSGTRGLDRVAIVQEAVGVLIVQGLEPAAAYERPVADAHAASVPIVDHAAAVIAEAVRAAAYRRGSTE